MALQQIREKERKKRKLRGRIGIIAWNLRKRTARGIKEGGGRTSKKLSLSQCPEVTSSGNGVSGKDKFETDQFPERKPLKGAESGVLTPE